MGSGVSMITPWGAKRQVQWALLIAYLKPGLSPSNHHFAIKANRNQSYDTFCQPTRLPKRAEKRHQELLFGRQRQNREPGIMRSELQEGTILGRSTIWSLGGSPRIRAGESQYAAIITAVFGFGLLHVPSPPFSDFFTRCPPCPSLATPQTTSRRLRTTPNPSSANRATGGSCPRSRSPHRLYDHRSASSSRNLRVYAFVSIGRALMRPYLCLASADPSRVCSR